MGSAPYVSRLAMELGPRLAGEDRAMKRAWSNQFDKNGLPALAFRTDDW